jgi:outer membrane protein
MRIFSTLLFACCVLFAQAQQVYTLEQCLKRAEEKNLLVLNAMLDEELATIARDQSKWDLLPDLNGVATHGYNFGRVVDRFTNTFANDRVRTNNFFVQSNVALFEGGSRVNRIRQAGIEIESAEQAREAVLNDVRVEVVQAFLDVLGLRERIKASEAQAATTREQITFTEALVEGGRLAQAELLTLRAQLAQEEFNVTDVQNQHDQRLLALGRGLQLDLTELYDFDIQAPVISGYRVVEPTADAATVLENVLKQNPAYIRAGLDLESSQRGIAIARASVMPALSFNASAGTGFSGLNKRIVGEPTLGTPTPIGFTASGETVFTQPLNYNTELTPFVDQLNENLNESVGLTLSVPLFNNMRNRNSVAQARIREEQTRNRMLSVRNDLQRNVLDALVMQRNSFRQFQAAERAVDAGTLALEYAEERFKAGAITSIELSTSKTQLNRNEAEQINAKYQYLMASKYLDILQGIPVTL